MRSLFIAVSGAILTFILGFIFGEGGLYILPALGFFVAVFWPTILAVAMVYFGPDAPVMTSAVIVIGSALNSGLQYLIGLTNSLAGPAWGYRSCLLYAVLIIAALAVLARRMRRPYIAPIP
jgi:fucose permease